MKKFISLLLISVLMLSLFPGTAFASKETVKGLLNSAKLTPMTTGDEETDRLVKAVTDKYIKKGMSTFEKVVALYDYCAKNFTYQSEIHFIDSDLYEKYASEYDAMIIDNGRSILRSKKGVCDHFAAMFMILTRAVGLDCYVVSGSVQAAAGGMTGHAWNAMKLNGKYYYFDTQLANKYYKLEGEVYYSWFGTDPAKTSSYQCDDIKGFAAQFCNFEELRFNLLFDVPDENTLYFEDETLTAALVECDTNIDIYGIYFLNFDGYLYIEDLYGLSDEQLLQNPGTEYSFRPSVCDGTLFILIDTEKGLLVQPFHYFTASSWEFSCIVGDCDFDDQITAADARYVLRASVGLEFVQNGTYRSKLCDADRDGEITAADARLILRASVGLEELGSFDR